LRWARMKLAVPTRSAGANKGKRWISMEPP
jgi:hypothetical protein